ncbi:MAG: hypothetical protein JKY55_20090 [Aliivibrio sp.]|uniref:hypothetical protein n=1 Tax=Aliivibrio sp. TaxID=1872443 RepID=UPI001A45CCAC|nr:hypothetical protein [Aliivibrio sp.]
MDILTNIKAIIADKNKSKQVKYHEIFSLPAASDEKENDRVDAEIEAFIRTLTLAERTLFEKSMVN